MNRDEIGCIASTKSYRFNALLCAHSASSSAIIPES